MNRPRIIKGLRIAWAAWWGIVCVLLVVLWWRSYWWHDIRLYNSGSYVVGAGSAGGVVQIAAFPTQQQLPLGWARESGYMTGVVIRPEFDVTLTRKVNSFNLPHSFIAVLCVVTATVPFSWRFSLRALLIVTTVIALLMGAFVWIRS